jgi:outer membrane protein assembly factor BamD (BamD/ComL family)
MAQDAVPAAPVDPIVAAFGAIHEGQFQEAELQMAQIPSPAAKLFVQACIQRVKGDLKGALETTGELIARYPNDPDWIAKGELMIAALYMETGMLDAADVTARQIQKIYEGTDLATRATALRSQIDQLKKETEEKGSIK